MKTEDYTWKPLSKLPKAFAPYFDKLKEKNGLAIIENTVYTDNMETKEKHFERLVNMKRVFPDYTIKKSNTIRYDAHLIVENQTIVKNCLV